MRMTAPIAIAFALLAAACGGADNSATGDTAATDANMGAMDSNMAGGEAMADANMTDANTAGADAGGAIATAALKDASGAAKGNVTFAQAANGVRLTVEVSGMPAGVHGIHVHTTGKCEGPKFESAGGHFNPTNKTHGSASPSGMHLGDMPNISVAEDGTGTFEQTLAGATVTGGANALMDADGAALIVHAKPDDYKTDPSGNSGDRLACGVITAG